VPSVRCGIAREAAQCPVDCQHAVEQLVQQETIRDRAVPGLSDVGVEELLLGICRQLECEHGAGEVECRIHDIQLGLAETVVLEVGLEQSSAVRDPIFGPHATVDERWHRAQEAPQPAMQQRDLGPVQVPSVGTPEEVDDLGPA